MQNAAFVFFVVSQAAWQTKCDDEVSLHYKKLSFFSLSSWTHFDAVLHIHNIVEKENINVVYLETETKPFTQNAYLLCFLSALHSRLTQESPKTCKMNASST